MDRAPTSSHLLSCGAPGRCSAARLLGWGGRRSWGVEAHTQWGPQQEAGHTQQCQGWEAGCCWVQEAAVRSRPCPAARASRRGARCASCAREAARTGGRHGQPARSPRGSLRCCLHLRMETQERVSFLWLTSQTPSAEKSSIQAKISDAKIKFCKKGQTQFWKVDQNRDSNSFHQGNPSFSDTYPLVCFSPSSLIRHSATFGCLPCVTRRPAEKRGETLSSELHHSQGTQPPPAVVGLLLSSVSRTGYVHHWWQRTELTAGARLPEWTSSQGAISPFTD